MSNESQQWMVKEGSGRIAGPFTTERVLELISSLILTGEEMVSAYPKGEWISISRHPEFYDRLLEIISLTQGRPREEIELPNENENPEPPPLDKTEFVPPEEPILDAAQEPPKPKAKKVKPPKVIELADIRAHVRKQKKKRAKGPLFLATSILMAGIAALLMYEPPQQKLRLILPRRGRPQMSSKEGQKRFEAAVSEFSLDNFESYRRAMNILVPVAEGMPRSGPVWQMLCLTYRELWPFTFQDQKEYEAVGTVAKMAEETDPGGVFSETCRVINALVNGRIGEARTQVEGAIEKAPTSAVLYEIKGSILGGSVESIVDGDFANGYEYVNKSIQLWPEWLKPRVLSAVYLRKLGDTGQALQRLSDVLKANQSHDVARAIYGLIYFKDLNKPDNAITQLLPIAESKQLPRILSSDVNFALASIFSQRGESAKAGKYAKIAYKLNPSNKDARELARKYGGSIDSKDEAAMAGALYVGDQFYAKGDYLAAQAEYKAAFEANPKNGMAALKAAKSLWKIGQAQDAMDWLDKAIRSNPNLVEAYVTKAAYYTDRYDFLAASTMLNKALVVSRTSFEAFRGFASMEMRRNNPQGAIKSLETALKLNPTDVEANVLLARAYLAQKNISEAYRIASKAIELENSTYETQDIYAKSLAQLQGVDTANLYIRKLIETYPKIVDYRIILGDLYMQDEKFAEAESVFRQITQIDSKKKVAFWGLGKAMQLQGKFKEAIDPMLAAAALDPGDATSWFLLGQLYISAGLYQKALSMFETVINKNPIYPLAHLSMGRVAQKLGNWDLALSEAMKEETNNPGSPESYLLAAEIYSQQQRYTQCTEEIQKALRLSTQGAQIYVVLARCYRLSGSLDTALSMIRIAADKESGLADVYLELGLIYENKREISEALTAFNQYLVLAPNGKDADQVKQKINSLGQ